MGERSTRVRCWVCNGTGAEYEETCLTCGGKGETYADGRYIFDEDDEDALSTEAASKERGE